MLGQFFPLDNENGIKYGYCIEMRNSSNVTTLLCNPALYALASITGS